MRALTIIAAGSLVGLAACGGGGTSGPKNGAVSDADFIGNWALSTGTLATQCVGSSATSATLTSGDVNLQIADTGEELQVTFNAPDDANVSCNADFTLPSTDNATLSTNSGCQSSDTGAEYAFSQASTLMLSSGHLAADISYSKTPEFSGASCNEHLQAVFTKF